MQAQGGEPARMRQERIGEMHIHLGHQQRRQEFRQLRRHLAQLHHYHRADAVSDIVLLEQFFTCSGSLTMIRAMAESVDSEMLIATTWVLWVWSSFTTSIIAPTLFGKKIENCLTSGPSIFELVCGRATSMRQKARREPVHPAATRESMASGRV